MGCDFHWNGAIPSVVDQQTAVALYREMFPIGDEPCVEPEPSRRVSAAFLSSIFAPLSMLDGEARRVDEYSFDFFGVAPFLGSGSEDIGRSGQIVFDRSDEGRLVSIALAATEGGYGPLTDRGLEVVVWSGGYLRLVDYSACAAMGLFLTLLRCRSCPGLRCGDDRLFVDRVSRAMAAGGFMDEALAPELDAESLRQRFLDAFLWSPDDAETGRTALDPMPGI